jgi:hypothetical protein
VRMKATLHRVVVMAAVVTACAHVPMGSDASGPDMDKVDELPAYLVTHHA